jgi:hypothetical protein
MLMTQDTVEMFYHLRFPKTLPSVINFHNSLTPAQNISQDALPELKLYLHSRYTIYLTHELHDLIVLLHNKLQYNITSSRKRQWMLTIYVSLGLVPTQYFH